MSATAVGIRQPRVLFVIPGQAEERGGSMIFARRQALTLADAGVGVDIFFLGCRTSAWKLALDFVRFRRLLARTRAQVVHAHFGTMTALFAALASGSTPLVITFRGSDLNPCTGPSTLRAILGRIFSQLAALRAAKIVCVSQQLRDQLWWARDRAVVLPSGVDTESFRPRPRATARKQLGWSEQERIVLFNAGFDPRNKRLDLAEAAVRAASVRMPGLRMEVLRGATNAELIPVMMNAADCLLVTSDSEGSPTVVQEALATNLPIVSVAVGDIPERLHGVSHTRIARRDAAALAEALVELVSVPIRSNGRDSVGEISSAHIARQLCRLYQETQR